MGWEDPLEEETATHSSILAWIIPWAEEPSPAISCAAGRAGVVGSTTVTMAPEQGGKTEAAPWP